MGRRNTLAHQQLVDLKSWAMSPRQICDIELILNGGFAPLESFLSKADYESVLKDMRLSSGQVWPMPVTLDVSTAFAESLTLGETIVLRDQEGLAIATLDVSEKWSPDKTQEAQHVFGTTDTAHPAVNYLMTQAYSKNWNFRIVKV